MKTLLISTILFSFISVFQAKAGETILSKIQDDLIGLYNNAEYMGIWHPTDNIKHWEQVSAHLEYSKSTLRSFHATFEGILNTANQNRNSISERQYHSINALKRHMDLLIRKGVTQKVENSMTNLNGLYSSMANAIRDTLVDFEVSDYSLNSTSVFESYIRIFLRSIKDSSGFEYRVMSYPKIPILQIIKPYEIEYMYLVRMANSIANKLNYSVLEKLDLIKNPELKSSVEALKKIVGSRERMRAYRKLAVGEIYSGNVSIERYFFSALQRLSFGPVSCSLIL